MFILHPYPCLLIVNCSQYSINLSSPSISCCFQIVMMVTMVMAVMQPVTVHQMPSVTKQQVFVFFVLVSKILQIDM